MGTMYEKGQTKRYSRVAAFKEGKEVKRKRTVGRKKPDDLLAMERDNNEQTSKQFREGFLDLPGSFKRSGKIIMEQLKPVIDDIVQKRPAMREGGQVEPKNMVRREVAFMKKAGAPKSMIKHEQAEMNTKRMAAGGGASTGAAKNPPSQNH